jgi:hypothetical protein
VETTSEELPLPGSFITAIDSPICDDIRKPSSDSTAITSWNARPKIRPMMACSTATAMP